MLGIGVTATDTEIGKTVVSGALWQTMRHRGYKLAFTNLSFQDVLRIVTKLISTDASFTALRGAKCEKHDQVVPYVLRPALAPAEASRLAGSIKIDPCNAGRSKGDAFGQSNQYS